MESQDFDMIFDEEYPEEENRIDDVDVFLSLEEIMEQRPQNSPKNNRQVKFVETQNMISWAKIIDENEHRNETSSQTFFEEHNEGLFTTKSCRAKNFIQVSDKKRKDYIYTLKGQKQQTSELNINLKTLTKTMLKQQFLFNDFNQSEEDVIRNFEKANANFKSFRELYGVEDQQEDKDDLQQTGEDNFVRKGRRTQTQKTEKFQEPRSMKRTSRRTQTEKSRKYIITKKSDKIRKLCLKNFSSCRMIRQTLKSGRMNPYNKIVTLKFLEQVRDGVIKPEQFQSWKSKVTFKK